MSTRDQERRQRLIEQRRAQRRGRPKGSTVPLLEHPRRFETAAWLAATEGLGYGPSEAATAIAGIFSTTPIEASTVDDVVLKLSAGVGSATLKGKADRVRRRAAEALDQAVGEEAIWLTSSATYLLLWLQHGDDAAAASLAIMRLRQLGWSPVFSRIAKRLNDALQSNLPPAEGPVPRKVRQFVEDLKAKPEIEQ